MHEKGQVAKHCVKVDIRRAKNDFAYWQTVPYQDRLETLEQIRQEFHRWKYGAEPRLQRIYTIVKR